MDNVWKELGKFANAQIPVVIQFALDVILALVVFAIGTRVIKWIRKVIKRSMEKANADMGVRTFMDSFVKFALYFVLIFMIGSNFGIDATSVAAILASAGVAVGLALQGSLSNFAGGVLILILKPFVVGDYIIEDSHKQEGTVVEIQIFYTKLATVDNKIIVIPNGSLANNSLTNVTAQKERRVDLNVGVSYRANLKDAKAVIENVVKKNEKVLLDKEIVIYVDQLGEHAVNIGVRSWVKSEDYWTTRWELLESIKVGLDEAGIEIPYPQIDVHMK